jgi:hypothetical protein
MILPEIVYTTFKLPAREQLQEAKDIFSILGQLAVYVHICLYSSLLPVVASPEPCDRGGVQQGSMLDHII